MAKQRKHQGLRADGKLRKGFKYSGKRNKNGTARIVKVVQKKKMKGGEKQVSKSGKCKMHIFDTDLDKFTLSGTNRKKSKADKNRVPCHELNTLWKGKKIYCAKFRNYNCVRRDFTNSDPFKPAEYKD